MANFKDVRENTKNLTLLYVEDDISVQEVSSELFAKYFLRVDVASNGVEGLSKYKEYLQENGKHYDLVITDIFMDQMDGLEMIKNILQIDDFQSIVISSSNSDIDYLVKAMNMGVSSFISKPLNLDTFNSVIYKISQAIIDRKFVDEHVENIETLNLELTQKIEQLEKAHRQLNHIADKEMKREIKKQESTNEATYSEEDIQYFYLQIEQIKEDELDDLEDLLDQMDRIVLEMSRDVSRCSEYTYELGKKLQLYASRISFYNIFHTLTMKITEFAQFVLQTEINPEQDGREYVITLLESFIFMLNKWQHNIVNSDIHSVNYFDDSIISDIDTIMISWSPNEADESFDDDIFF